MDVDRAKREGQYAASAGQSADECPYSFAKVNVSQATFDREYRPLLDAWFAGWVGWLDEHGLGTNRKPKQPHRSRP